MSGAGRSPTTAKPSAAWVGDAVRVVQALAPNDAALAAAAQMLGLHAAAGSPAHADAQAQRGAEQRAEHPHGAAARPDAPPVPPVQPPSTAADGPDHRLPSVMQHDAATARPRPDWVAGTTAMQIDADRPTAAAQPLLARTHRRAMLSLALGEPVPEGMPDWPAILHALGHAKPLRRIPRRPRRTLRYGVEVLIDRADWLQAFHRDQDALLRYVRQLLPGDRVRWREINGAPPDDRAATDAWGVDDDVPAALEADRAVVLLLSDLGAGYRATGPAPAAPEVWRRYAHGLRAQGRRCLALVPFAPHRWVQGSGIAQLHWSETSSLRDVLRLLQGGMPAAPAGTAADGVAAVTELATLLSPALRIEPALMREVRLRLASQLDVGVEADLWMSPLVQSRGHAGIVLQPVAAQRLRAALATRDELLPVLDLVRADESGRAASIRLEQRLYRVELGGEMAEEDVEPELREALKAVSQPGAPGRKVAVWVAHAWARFSPALRRSNAARQLAFVAAARTGSFEWLAQGADGPPALPSDADWLLPPGSFPQLTRCVELRRYADGTVNLVIGEQRLPTCALHAIELPQTEPLWLQVEVQAPATPDGKQPAPQTELLQIDPGAATQMHLGAARPGTTLMLQALTGPRHRLSLAEPAPALARSVLALDRRSAGLGTGLMPAVVVERRFAVVPWGLDAQQNSGSEAELAQVTTRLRLRHPDGGEDLRARVVGELNLGYGDRAVVIKLLAAASAPIDAPPAAPWRTLDPEVLCPATADQPHARHLLIRMSAAGELDTRPATRQDDGSYSVEPGTVAGRFSTAIVAPVIEPGWTFILRSRRIFKGDSRDDPELVQPTGYDFQHVCQEALWLAAERWTSLLIAAPDAKREADALQQALAERLGAGRVFYEPDAVLRLSPGSERSSALQDALAECDMILLVGAIRGTDWLNRMLRLAIATGVPVRWAPFHSAPETVLRDWPEDIATAVRHRQWFGLRSDGGVDEPAAVAEQVARWRPDNARPLASEAPPPDALADVVPIEHSFGTSVRAKFASMIERRNGEELGLFRCDLGQALTLAPAESLLSGKPLLLLLHGEASTTEASFGGLAEAGADAQRARLHEHYADRCLAFEYRSVTVGPVANALALVQALPAQAVLHIVSVGGGGIIGELLCRGERDDKEPPFTVAPASGASAEASEEPGWRSSLALLSAELQRKRVRIERFVRIACPSQGTHLFSKGLSRAVSASEVALVLTPWLSKLPRLLGADRLFSDPQATPGLTALATDSALVRLLNEPVVTRSALTVLTGRTEKSGFFGWLGPSAAQLFSGESRSDLVVPVASAFGGMERRGGVDYLVLEGSDIDHFKYLSHPRSRQAVIDALLTPSGTPPGLAHAERLADLRARFASISAPA